MRSKTPKSLENRKMTLVVTGFFFQAEDGIRDYKVTGVQTCALPIFARGGAALGNLARLVHAPHGGVADCGVLLSAHTRVGAWAWRRTRRGCFDARARVADRKSTRLNSSHLVISYAVFCLKKKQNYLQ